MTDILVGAKIRAEDFPPAVFASDTTTLSNLSNTEYLQGSPVVSVTFVAPTSGRVLLTVSAGMRDNSGTNRVHVAPIVRVGNASGSLFLSADVSSRGVGSPSNCSTYMYFSRTTLLTGLTPGQTYYAHTAHKVSGGSTADINVRTIMVEPTL